MADLLGRTELDSRQRTMVQTINEAGDDLLGVLNAILDFSKAESGKITLELQEFNLPKHIESSVIHMAEKARDKGLEFIVEVDKSIPQFVYGDLDKVSQVVSNLLSNAIKFTESGSVIFSVKMVNISEDTVTLRTAIEDTGIGIAKHKQEQIFQAFEQEDSSVTRKYGGMGLGLAVSTQLIELMGSKIELESEPGKGSRFWFDLNLPYTTTPTMDMELLKQETGGNAELIRKTMELFTANAPVLKDKIQSAIDNDDNEALKVSANSLKSYIAYFSKAGAYNHCAPLEDIVRNGVLPAKHAHAAELFREQLVPALQKNFAVIKRILDGEMPESQPQFLR